MSLVIVLKSIKKIKKIDTNNNLKLDTFFSSADNNNTAIAHLSSLLYESHFTHTHTYTHTYQSRIHY